MFSGAYTCLYAHKRECDASASYQYKILKQQMFPRLIAYQLFLPGGILLLFCLLTSLRCTGRAQHDCALLLWLFFEWHLIPPLFYCVFRWLQNSQAAPWPPCITIAGYGFAPYRAGRRSAHNNRRGLPHLLFPQRLSVHDQYNSGSIWAQTKHLQTAAPVCFERLLYPGNGLCDRSGLHQTMTLIKYLIPARFSDRVQMVFQPRYAWFGYRCTIVP